MAKRFTDTEKWKKSFIRKLSPENKLFWIYLLDDCNHAGIWEVDFEIANVRLGFKYDQSEMEKIFADKIVVFDDKWFIPSFIEFQYGQLNDKNTVHKSILTILSKYGLQGAMQGAMQAPSQGAKDKDMDKDKEMDKEMDKDKENKNEIFLQKWNDLAEKHGLSKTVVLNDTRKSKLKTRLKKDNNFLEHFDLALLTIPTKPFLLGKNNRGWEVTFDWLIDNDINYIKICEGQYKGKEIGKHSDEEEIKKFLNMNKGA